MWAIKLCYKPYTKGENKDNYHLNFKRPWFNLSYASTLIDEDKSYTCTNNGSKG